MAAIKPVTSHTPLRDTSRAQIKGNAYEPLQQRIDDLKAALDRHGYGDVPIGDILGALVATCEIENAAQVDELFDRIKHYRTMTTGELLRMPTQDDPSVVQFNERKPGRKRRKQADADR